MNKHKELRILVTLDKGTTERLNANAFTDDEGGYKEAKKEINRLEKFVFPKWKAKGMEFKIVRCINEIITEVGG